MIEACSSKHTLISAKFYEALIFCYFLIKQKVNEKVYAALILPTHNLALMCLCTLAPF
jgi:hypothetical protein